MAPARWMRATVAARSASAKLPVAGARVEALVEPEVDGVGAGRERRVQRRVVAGGRQHLGLPRPVGHRGDASTCRSAPKTSARRAGALFRSTAFSLTPHPVLCAEPQREAAMPRMTRLRPHRAAASLRRDRRCPASRAAGELRDLRERPGAAARALARRHAALRRQHARQPARDLRRHRAASPVHTGSVTVGLEPVAVAVARPTPRSGSSTTSPTA